MAFNRDQSTNEVKLSDDETLAKQQTEKRETRHPKSPSKSIMKYKIGDNVIITWYDVHNLVLIAISDKRFYLDII